MINVTLEVDQVSLTHYLKALDGLVNRVKFQFTENGGAMNRRCAAQIATKFVEGITSQRFATQYQRYSLRYGAWKQLMGLADAGFGKLKGDLIKSLTHYREETGWMGGIAKGAMDSGGKSWFTRPGRPPQGRSKPISMYAYVMEYGGDFRDAGGGIHPKRALFVPITNEFADTTWIEEANKALESIERQWA
jgi:hypothetical protein